MCSLLTRQNILETCDIGGILKSTEKSADNSLILHNLSHISDIPALSHSPSLGEGREGGECYPCPRLSLVSEEGMEDTFTNYYLTTMGQGVQTSMFLSTSTSVIGDGGGEDIEYLACLKSPGRGRERIEDPKTTEQTENEKYGSSCNGAS